jgi:hypothetical protein
MSFHLAVSFSIGSMFLDSAHFLIFKEGIPFEKIKEDKEYIENRFQKFIHNVNHLSHN